MCSWFEHVGSVVVYLVNRLILLLEKSASPFIDEGGGLTSKRERVRTLLSLAAHAGGYKMMVGAHNTV